MCLKARKLPFYCLRIDEETIKRVVRIIRPQEHFVGDLIVVLYLLIIPAIALILGASSSKNPLASIGASREMKLVLAYELPFILTIIAIIVKSGGTIQLSQILNRQAQFGYAGQIRVRTF